MKALLRPAGVLAVAGVLFLGTGCGGDGEAASAGPETPSGAARPSAQISPGAPAGQAPVTDPSVTRKARQQMDDCLRRAGMKGIPTNYEKVSKKQQQALQKCGLDVLRSLAPSPGE